MLRTAAAVSCVACLFGHLPAVPAVADDETRLTADRFTHERHEFLIRAEGNVEFVQGERSLRSDRLLYRYREDRVLAEGSVLLVDADGIEYQAERVEFTGGFQEGVVEALRARFPAGTTLEAELAVRENPDRTEFTGASFTRCDTCPDDSPGAVPWKILARSAAHDRTLRAMVYRNLTFEAFGVPIFYLPYLSHPELSVERASGFLVPQIRHDQILGLVYEQPYFYVLGPHQNLILNPSLTSTEGAILAGTWERALARGDLRVAGSLTQGRRNLGDTEVTREVRGHVDIRGSYGLGDGWEAGTQIVRASDRTYLARYGFGRGSNVLTQHGYLRRRDGRFRTDIDLYSFQTLSNLFAPDRVPLILPHVQIRCVRDCLAFPGHVGFGLDALFLSQEDGRQNRRISAEGTWRKQFRSRTGHLTDLVARVRGDLYSTEAGTDDSPEVSGFTSRFLPELEATWRFPVVGRFLDGHLVLEPVVQVLAAPEDVNPEGIPDTDSSDVELSTVTLFDPNRFPGLDRVEGGLRVNYGGFATYRSESGLVVRGLLGQVLRPQAFRDFPTPSGLTGTISDLVGGLSLRAVDQITAYYNFRRPTHRGSTHFDQVGAQGTLGPLDGGLSFIRHDEGMGETPDVEPDTFRQLRLDLTWRISPEWSVSGFHLGDKIFAGQQGLQSGLAATYENECIRITIAYENDRTRTLDLPPTSTVGVTVDLIGL